MNYRAITSGWMLALVYGGTAVLAQDARPVDSPRERFLREAPKGWDAIEAGCKRLSCAATETRTNIFNDRPLTTTMTTEIEYKRAHPDRGLLTRVSFAEARVTEGAEPQIKSTAAGARTVQGFNPDYGFRVSRAGDGGPYVLKGRDASRPSDRRSTRFYVDQFHHLTTSSRTSLPGH